MPYKKISFKEFAEFISNKYDPNNPEDTQGFIPYAWLLGAGISVSSGIPLANGICERMAVFEYLKKVEKTKPWDKENSSSIRNIHRDFKAFFKWWNEQDRIVLQEKVNLAFQYFRKVDPDFESMEEDIPRYYQKLFPIVLPEKQDQTIFLSSIINLAEGVNLATLGLAGILRDFPRWGHTIFTTNFDDLILQAVLSLGHNARIFNKGDDLGNLDVDPRLPQIVYLHGVHTDYFIDNDELTNYDSRNKEQIVSLLKKSNLIVLGYSGWQDIAMGALKELQDTKSNLKGNIFWIPYLDESDITEEVQGFLNDFPSGRVYVVENTAPAPPLDADAFVMSLCRYLNNKEGGIATYRNEFLNQARRQHNFILNQLDDYPDFDPKTGLLIIEQARQYYKEKDIPNAKLYRDKARSLIQEDLPGHLKAELWQALGIFDLMLKDYASAENSLTEAFKEWQSLIALEVKEAHHEIFTTRLALAECKLRTANFYEAKEHLIRAQVLLNKKMVNGADKAGHVALLFTAVALYEGAGGAIKPNLDAFVEKTAELERADHPLLFAHYYFLSGIQHYNYTLRISKAKKDFSMAIDFYETVGQTSEKANCLKYLADIEMRNNEFEAAQRKLNDCLIIYQENEDELGKANVYSSIGDLNFQRAILEDESLRRKAAESALEAYRTTISICRQNKFNYNLINSIADLLELYRELILQEEWGAEEVTEEKYDNLKNELAELLEETKNAYGSSRLKTLTQKSKQEQLEQLIDDEEE